MYTLNSRGRLRVIDRPWVMGILNITPDSFFSGSRVKDHGDIIARAERMIEEGAMILDIGGQSTRPGSEMVDEPEELRRVIPAIEALHVRFPEMLLSVDTFYARVASEAVAAGAGMINDVSAGSVDAELLQSVATLNVPYVLTHMKGIPATMQDKPHYDDVVLEVFDSLNFKVHSLTQMGIRDVIIDPGFGFGKSASHNFQLLKDLRRFSEIGRPIMAGLSRKGTIYRTLGITADEALNGTTVLNTMALLNGASILRVHDVKEAVQAIKLLEKMNVL